MKKISYVCMKGVVNLGEVSTHRRLLRLVNGYFGSFGNVGSFNKVDIKKYYDNS